MSKILQKGRLCPKVGQGCGDRGRGDSGTQKLRDVGTRGCGNAFSKYYRISEMGKHPNVKWKLNSL